MTHPYYAETRWRREVYRARLAECRHEKRAIETDFGDDGGTARYCCDCSQAAHELERAYREAYKRARKRQLADTPRCEVPGCNRRGTWRFPYGVLVCGIHKRRMMGAHCRAADRLSGLAFAIPFYSNRADVLAFATEEAWHEANHRDPHGEHGFQQPRRRRVGT